MSASRAERSRAAPRGAPATGAGALERRFLKLGLRTPQDFLLHLPLRYEDETRITPIDHALGGDAAQVEGEITHCEITLRPRRQLKATLVDESGQIGLRWLNFYPSQQKQVAVGNRVRARGEVRAGLFGKEIVHPRITRAEAPLPEALTPVYPTTEGLAQPALRRAIAAALRPEFLQDRLPAAVRERYELMPFDQALHLLHAPPPGPQGLALQDAQHPAWRRVKFDELLAQQLGLSLARAARRAQRAEPLPRRQPPQPDSLTERLRAALPFTLTEAQTRVVDEIAADLGRRFPMLRLLQGDVGSGKTVVAALAAAQVIEHGAQVAIMAPTEILAEQHYLKLRAWLEPLGVTLAWLSGRLTPARRRDACERLASGQAQLAVGTQALIQEYVDFARLGLVVVDEQHRFGVGQRLALGRKGEEEADVGQAFPHQLMMSATPIPRTLAMTFFADLDVSVIDTLPPGRTPVRTKLVADTRRDELLGHVAQAVRDGQQAYWVCPLVEESEALQLQTAVDTFETLRTALPDVTVGLVHGKLPAAQKAAVMDAFRAGEVGLLVATTVIEVGVDVPNASLMVIEHAERFGLAQLHQLRGRVGRGQAESVCVLLFQAPLSAVARQRLQAMFETTDGFEIARRDLEQRGPGEFLGVRQSGEALLRFADLQADTGLVEQARESAAWMQREFPDAAREHLRLWSRGRQDFLKT